MDFSQFPFGKTIKTDGVIVSRQKIRFLGVGKAICQFKDKNGTVWHGDVECTKSDIGAAVSVEYQITDPSRNLCLVKGEIIWIHWMASFLVISFFLLLIFGSYFNVSFLKPSKLTSQVER